MIHALVGINSFQIKSRLDALRQDFVKKHGEEGVESYMGEEITPVALQNIMGGISLFASHRLVIIRYLSENKPMAEQFTEKTEQIPEETTVILIESNLDKRTAYYKALKKLKHFHEYGEPDERELNDWAKQFVSSEQAVIAPDALKALLMAVGTDQSRLANELAKLTAYSKEITIQIVHELVEANPQDNVFALLDAALTGRQQKAQKLLANLERAHEDPYEIIGMLIWQVHILAVVASAAGSSEGEVAKRAKINPYVVKKTVALSRSLSGRTVRHIIHTVAELDVSMKTKSVQPWPMIGQALYQFGSED